MIYPRMRLHDAPMAFDTRAVSACDKPTLHDNKTKYNGKENDNAACACVPR